MTTMNQGDDKNDDDDDDVLVEISIVFEIDDEEEWEFETSITGDEGVIMGAIDVESSGNDVGGVVDTVRSVLGVAFVVVDFVVIFWFVVWVAVVVVVVDDDDDDDDDGGDTDESCEQSAIIELIQRPRFSEL